MNWRIKGVVQKTLSYLPGGVAVNDLLQLTLGGLRNFRREVANKVDDWTILAGHMNELGVPLQGLHYVEIGTGWFPTLPICYYLAGAARVITYDLSRHLSARLTGRLLRILGAHLDTIAVAARRSREEVAAALQGLLEETSLGERLRRAGIEYCAPADAAASGLPPASIDVVFSNSVLEHVHPADIQRAFEESRRILRPGGLAVHSVNCGDHYAYFDRNISAINYLTYPEQKWQRWNNALTYQNRLRPQDFLDMAEAAGLRVVLRKHRPRPQLLELLPTMKIAPEFQKYPPEQLCCTSIDFVARNPGP